MNYQKVKEFSILEPENEVKHVQFALWKIVKNLSGLLSLIMLAGCATVGEHGKSREEALIFGRIETVVTGPTMRIFKPAVRFFEIQNKDTGERFRVDVESADATFVFNLPPGKYELTRLQIMEGAFRSMAQITSEFHVSAAAVNYLGNWQVHVASPTFFRPISIEILNDLVEDSASLHATQTKIPDLPIRFEALTPVKADARLFHGYPYPRFKYFNRHHPT